MAKARASRATKKKAPARPARKTARAPSAKGVGVKRAPAKPAAPRPAPRAKAAPGAWRNAPSMYGVHPGVSMVQQWLATLREKTGRTLDDWVRLIRKEGPADEKARREWLKVKHGLGTNSAWWLAERATKPAPERGWDDNPESYLEQAVEYVDRMYSGGKETLRPIHMRLVALVEGLGREAKMCPCQTIVPVYRHRVIAQIKPRNRTTIEFGFALGDMKPSGALIDTGGFAKKDRITHALEITSPTQVNAEAERWLREAFARDAEGGRRSRG